MHPTVEVLIERVCITTTTHESDMGLHHLELNMAHDDCVSDGWCTVTDIPPSQRHVASGGLRNLSRCIIFKIQYSMSTTSSSCELMRQ